MVKQEESEIVTTSNGTATMFDIIKSLLGIDMTIESLEIADLSEQEKLDGEEYPPNHAEYTAHVCSKDYKDGKSIKLKLKASGNRDVIQTNIVQHLSSVVENKTFTT